MGMCSTDTDAVVQIEGRKGESKKRILKILVKRICMEKEDHKI